MSVNARVNVVFYSSRKGKYIILLAWGVQFFTTVGSPDPKGSQAGDELIYPHAFFVLMLILGVVRLKSCARHAVVYKPMGCWWCTIHLYGSYRDYDNRTRYVSEEPFEVPKFDFQNKASIARIVKVRYPDAVDCSGVQVFYHGHDEFK